MGKCRVQTPPSLVGKLLGPPQVVSCLKEVQDRQDVQEVLERTEKDRSGGKEGNSEVQALRLASAKWKSVFRSFIAFFMIPEKENALLP